MSWASAKARTKVRPMRPEAPATVTRIVLMESSYAEDGMARKSQPAPLSNLGIHLRALSGASAIRASTGAFGHRHHGRAQQPVTNGVAVLHDVHDRAGLGALCGHLGNGLMQMRIKTLSLRFDRLDAVTRQRGLQLTPGRFHAVDDGFDGVIGFGASV